MSVSSLKRNLYNRSVLATVCAMFLLTAGCLSSAYAQGADKKNPEPLLIAEDPIDPKQPISISFFLNVSVVGEAEPSGNYVVDASGDILIRIANVLTPIPLKGLTPAQASEAVTAVLRKYLKDPVVKVSIVATPNPVVFVSGAVRLPGAMVARTGITLIELLSKAEWAENADLNRVQVARRVEGSDKRNITVYRVGDFVRPLSNKEPDYAQNPTLADRDAVFVPLKNQVITLVSVSGEVLKPQYNLTIHTNPPTSVREAISLAGGVLPTGNRKRVKVVGANGESVVIIDLDKAEQGDSNNNVLLRPEDAVYVEKIDPDDYVFVNGGFAKPGKYIYKPNMTLTQAIMEAGGLAPFANVKEGRIIRRPDDNPKHTQFIAFEWKQLLSNKMPDIALKPGDSVWLAPGSPNPNSFNLLSALSSIGILFSALRR